MKCPHCLVRIFNNPRFTGVGSDNAGNFVIEQQICPACDQDILVLAHGQAYYGGGSLPLGVAASVSRRFIYPHRPIGPFPRRFQRILLLTTVRRPRPLT